MGGRRPAALAAGGVGSALQKRPRGARRVPRRLEGIDSASRASRASARSPRRWRRTARGGPNRLERAPRPPRAPRPTTRPTMGGYRCRSRLGSGLDRTLFSGDGTSALSQMHASSSSQSPRCSRRAGDRRPTMELSVPLPAARVRRHAAENNDTDPRPRGGKAAKQASGVAMREDQKAVR